MATSSPCGASERISPSHAEVQRRLGHTFDGLIGYPHVSNVHMCCLQVLNDTLTTSAPEADENSLTLSPAAASVPRSRPRRCIGCNFVLGPSANKSSEVVTARPTAAVGMGCVPTAKVVRGTGRRRCLRWCCCLPASVEAPPVSSTAAPAAQRWFAVRSGRALSCKTWLGMASLHRHRHHGQISRSTHG